MQKNFVWLLVVSCGAGSGSDTGYTGTVTVSNVPAADQAYQSSTSLQVEWEGGTGKLLRVTATESIGGTSVTAELEGTSVVLSGLKSATEYQVTVAAETSAVGSSSGTTAEEVWQFQGFGHSVEELSTVVEDGNAKIWGVWYGDDAPVDLAGRVQLYYGMLQSVAPGQSLGVALATAAASANDLSTLIPLTSTEGTAGLLSPETATDLLDSVMTGQAVPLASGVMRLYFESNGGDGHARILSVDSQDGLVGQDFNADEATVCSTTADYSAGGGCEPTLILDVNNQIPNVRQFKIGYPTLDNWQWDEAPGTFMFFTVDGGGSCGYDGFANQAYAVWDGASWTPVLKDDDCPEALESMQAPAPVHLGGVRYKVYSGNPDDTAGAVKGSMLPFLGPKQVLYGDGSSTGEATVVDFADWEAREAARGVTFLWPDATEFSVGEEGYIDDFVFMTPTGTTDLQVAYVVITDGALVPRPALAVLLNP